MQNISEEKYYAMLCMAVPFISGYIENVTNHFCEVSRTKGHRMYWDGKRQLVEFVWNGVSCSLVLKRYEEIKLNLERW